MLTSVGVGVVCALLVFALWWFTEWTRLCLFLNSLFLGFLVGATLMFTPFGKNLKESDKIMALYIFSLISVTFNLKIFPNFLGYIFQQDDVFFGAICMLN